MNDRDTVRPRSESALGKFFSRRATDKEQRDAHRRRSSALRDLRDAMLDRFAVIGESLGWLRDDTTRSRQQMHHVISSLASLDANVTLLLQGQQRQTKMLRKLLGEDSLPDTDSEDRQSV